TPQKSRGRRRTGPDSIGDDVAASSCAHLSEGAIGDVHEHEGDTDDEGDDDRLPGEPAPRSPPRDGKDESSRQPSPTRMRRPVTVVTPDVSVYSPPVLRPAKPPVEQPQTDPHRHSIELPSMTTENNTTMYDSRQFKKPTAPVNEAMARYMNRKERMRQSASAATPSPRPPKSPLTPKHPDGNIVSPSESESPSTTATAATMSPFSPTFATAARNHVQRTPRKLWNAIGAEDRRLIVLQRTNEK
ncbi:hypothetical protein As57867_007260, partial [Aphanomyces stellatus]